MRDPDAGAAVPAHATLLAVEIDAATLDALPPHLRPPRLAARHVSAEGLGAGALDPAPALVISPLVMAHLDAVDLAARLDRLGYPGPYLVLAPRLGDAGPIRDDIARVAPGLHATLVDPHAGRSLRAV